MDYKEFYINTIIIVTLTILTIVIGGYDLIVISAFGWIYYTLIHGMLFIPIVSKSINAQTNNKIYKN